MTEVDGIPVWGEVDTRSLEQAKRCLATAERVALMADHHPGYGVPIGGVVAYKGAISPTGVGYDIACGNKAVRLDVPATEVEQNIGKIMDEVFSTLSFGVGRKNAERVEDEVLDRSEWSATELLVSLQVLAAEQFGTIGSGNHYVDLFVDELGQVWVGVHFGSRGTGHKIATYYLRKAGAKNGMDVEPAVLPVGSDLGAEYLEAMQLAGDYAYAARSWVCQRVADLLGAQIVEEVHNHHNYAWSEIHDGEEFWVVRKGATPAWAGQRSFVGGSMGENAVILEGLATEESAVAMRSTVHGAGRVMSRREAAGKTKFKKGKRIQVSEGSISREMMQKWVERAGVELRGAGTDESPHCYKRLSEVVAAHKGSVRVLHQLRPIGVAMASVGEYDPFKD